MKERRSAIPRFKQGLSIPRCLVCPVRGEPVEPPFDKLSSNCFRMGLGDRRSPLRQTKAPSPRGFNEELAESIRRLAKRDGTSLNQAALKLLRKGAGLTDGKGNPGAIGSSLDDLFGAWSPEEAKSFNAALDIFELVDESAWDA